MPLTPADTRRMAGALIDWGKKYPVDLAEPPTQESFKEILDLVLPHLFMAHLTAELVVIDQGLPQVEDVDKSWSWDQPEPSSNNLLPVPLSAASDLVLDSEVLYDFESSIGKSENETLPTTTEASLTPSLRTRSSTSLQVAENYRQRESMPKSRVDLNGLGASAEEFGFGKWTTAANFVLNGDPGVFATELTKAQWTLFTAIRVSSSKPTLSVSSHCPATRYLPTRLRCRKGDAGQQVNHILQPRLAVVSRLHRWRMIQLI